nr:unnamed protein product [Callosobruchus chinensis]
MDLKMEIYQIEKKRLAPIVAEQKQLMVNFSEAHPELNSGKFSSTFKKQQRIYGDKYRRS